MLQNLITDNISEYDKNRHIAERFKINRYDSIYKEIESFETYEFTNCMAYEMAIRNQNLINILNKYDETYLCNSNNEIFKNERFNILIEYFFDIKEYLELKFNPKAYISRATRNIKIGNVDQIKTLVKDKISFIEFDKMSMREYKGKKISKKFIKSKYLISIESKSNFKTQQCFLIQSRPNLPIPQTLIYETPKLNLALPEEELLEQVKIYKKEYDRNKEIIKNEYELTNSAFERSKGNVKINDIEIEFRKHLNTNQKIADMFYIYDAKKVNMRNNDICMSITNYYYELERRNSFFDQKTLNKYFKIAKEYIDNLQYKDLITGLKLSK